MQYLKIKYWLILTTIVFHLVNAGVVSGQGSPEFHIRNIDVSSDGVISIAVSTLAASSKPIKGLSRGNFELKIDEMHRTITSVEEVGINTGLWIALAIDVSGSMAGKPMKDVQAAARTFLNSLSRNDRAAILSFESNVQTVSGFTSDKDRLSYLVNRLTVGDETSLNDAIYDCLSLTAPIPSNHKAIVILSDGEDNHSRVTLGDCVDLAEKAPAPIYTISYGTKMKPRQIQSTLGRISKLTGGKNYIIPSADDLNGLYQHILEQLKNEYVIQTSLPENMIDGKIHNIGLTIDLPYFKSTEYHNFKSPQPLVNESIVSLSTILFMASVVFFMGLFIGLIIYFGMKIKRSD